MALAFTTDSTGIITGLERTSFATRKAARVAAGAQQFRFQVVSALDFDGEVVGEFSSRKAADDFAFSQVGPMVGNSPAVRELQRRHPRAFISMLGAHWNIVRVIK